MSIGLGAGLVLSAGAAALLAGDSLLLVVLLACLLSYLVLSAGDILHAFSGLKAAFEHRRPERILSTAKRRPLTSLGRALSARIEALQYRFHNIESRLETESFLRSLNQESSLPDAPAPADKNAAQPFNKVLEYIGGKFECRGAALVVDGGAAEARRDVYASGITGRRFEAVLLNTVAAYFSRGDHSLFGVRDEESGRVLTGFGVFGLRYSVMHPVAWAEGEACRRAVLWLGYGAENPPRPDEYELVAQVVRKIEHELETVGQVYALAGKVAEAHLSARQKNEFIAHMSHDIRSPLNNIRAILTLFKLEGFAADSGEMIDVALSNCDSMSEIVEDILDYSKFSVGKLAAAPELIDLRASVMNVVESFTVSARLKGLALRVHLPDATCRVFADRKQIRRVISNLLSNAIKYTVQGGIDVHVQQSVSGAWALRVKDSGVGMTAAQVGRLFSPFTRFHGPEIEGIGLGLTLTKILVELNTGTITVVSVPGEGSDFLVSLPAAAAMPELQKNDRLQFEAQAGAPALRVLIVDDDPDCVVTLARQVALAGHQAIKALSIREALQIVGREHVDVVISDGCMPEGGGKELLRVLAQRRSRAAAIIISGRDGDAERNEFLSLGALRVLSKPANLDELLGVLKSIDFERSAAPAAQLVTGG